MPIKHGSRLFKKRSNSLRFNFFRVIRTPFLSAAYFNDHDDSPRVIDLTPQSNSLVGASHLIRPDPIIKCPY